MIHGGRCSGKLVTRRLAKYTPDLGLDGLEICDAVSSVTCSECRQVLETAIPNLDELIAAAALERVKIPVKLDAREIRLLRKALDWQSKALAKQLSVDPATVSR